MSGNQCVWIVIQQKIVIVCYIDWLLLPSSITILCFSLLSNTIFQVSFSNSMLNRTSIIQFSMTKLFFFSLSFLFHFAQKKSFNAIVSIVSNSLIVIFRTKNFLLNAELFISPQNSGQLQVRVATTTITKNEFEMSHVCIVTLEWHTLVFS